MQTLIVLIDRGMLTPDEALSVLDTQRKKRCPLGQLALQNGILTVNQIFQILTRSADTRELFGQAAIALGFLTETQLALLLHLQQNLLPSIPELLLEMDLCDAETLDRLSGRRRMSA